MKTSDFDFHEGPAFGDIVLADEINRAPAKTQAALFEVMEERQVDIDGVTHHMGPLYTILATQNPVEQEGTYRLPEAQLDRFLMKIVMGYPSLDEEVLILERHQRNAAFSRIDDIRPLLTRDELLQLRTPAQRWWWSMPRCCVTSRGGAADAPVESRLSGWLAACLGGHSSRPPRPTLCCMAATS
jgi:MoxR-like ATPase